MLASRPDPSRRFFFKYLVIISLFCGAGAVLPVGAQTGSTGSECKESLSFYETKGFVVKKIKVEHLVRFLPKAEVLNEGLSRAIDSLSPNDGLKIDQPFNVRKLSKLNIALSEELEELLIGQTGFQFVTPKLRNCEIDRSPGTLEVVYTLATTARAAYLSNNFELSTREDREQIETGNDKISERALSQKFYVGYNRSRGVYAGAKSVYRIEKGLIDKLNLELSASGSSTFINASVSGEKEFDQGMFSYAEWRLGYRFSNIPTEAVRLKDATLVGQFFAATKPVGSRNLYFRFGASLEGGNRQTDLEQPSLPAETTADAGHGALKFYVGGTFSGKNYDWKSSYGVQLGNSGNGLRVNYVKHIFDAAVRAHFLPADYKPLQFDLQFTAGLINRVSGSMPVGERFFGGNVEQEFIDGDSWRIRSNPYIRSYPQNRLNRLGPAAPAGGENFASFNFTVAQTVWNRRLVPKEIADSADVVAGLGGQLLSTRLFLREEKVQASQEIKDLQATIRRLTPSIDELKRSVEAVKSSEQNLPEDVLSTVETSIESVEDAVGAAVIDPNAEKPVISNQAELANFVNNPVEFNAVQLTVDFDEDNPSLINALRKSLTDLRAAVSQSNRERIDAALRTLETGASSINASLSKVRALRAYKPEEIEPLIKIIDETPTASGRKTESVLTEIRSLLEPLRASIKAEIDGIPDETQDEALKARRARLNDFRELLINADSYAEKSLAAAASAKDFFDRKEYADAKFDIERLTVGFGQGLRPLLVGLADSIKALEKPLAERNQEALWKNLTQSSDELLVIRKSVRSKFNRVPFPPAEKEANKTISYVSRIFGTLTRELNIIGISPVFMFDATRFGSGAPFNRSALRYGVGGGLRLSLVNLDFTAGYSVNPRRSFGEPAGAFVFRMDINDLFR